MKALVVEDDLTSRILLQEFLKPFGMSHVAVNGEEALEAVKMAIDMGEPYELICLDIIMPASDGQKALQKIRELEEAQGLIYPKGSKILMTTALGDMKNVNAAYRNLCDAYLTKPIHKAKFLEELRKMGFVAIDLS